MDFAAWLGVLDRYGWPTALLLVVGLLGWRFVRWMEPRASRVIDTHIETVTKLADQAGKTTSLLSELHAQQKDQVEMISEIHRVVIGERPTPTPIIHRAADTRRPYA